MAGAVAAQWVLSDTATGVLGFAAGIIHAANADNVQPLALIACEAFGAILAMSPESKLKVGKLCSREHDSAVLHYLKAKIGFVKGDSGWQLSQSDAGNRFLGLAACLYTIDTALRYKCAEMLVKLMADGAPRDFRLPSALAIHALLDALKYRLTDAGFAASVLQWEAWLYTIISQTELQGHYTNRNHISMPVAKTPSLETLASIIRALSSLARIGEVKSSRQFLTINIDLQHTAWTLAFLKWCLGQSPAIVDSNGKLVLNVPDYIVIVIIRFSGRDTASEPKLSLCDEVGSVSELTQAQSSGPICMPFQGMVTLQEFAEWSVRKCTWEFGEESCKAMLELIPYLCYKAYEKLNDFGPESGMRTTDLDIRPLPVFPARHVLGALIIKFLGIPSRDLLLLTKSPSFLSETYYQTVASKVRSKLNLKHARVLGRRSHATSADDSAYRAWQTGLRNYIGVILLTSLVQCDDHDEIMLSIRPNKELGFIVQKVLEPFLSPTSFPQPFLSPTSKEMVSDQLWNIDVAWNMLSELLTPDHAKDCTSSLGLSANGQTILYSILETPTLLCENFLIRCFRGALVRHDQVYHKLSASGMTITHLSGNHCKFESGESLGIGRADSGCRPLRWSIVADERCLRIGLLYAHGLEELNMYKALRYCSQGVYVSCKHGVSACRSVNRQIPRGDITSWNPPARMNVVSTDQDSTVQLLCAGIMGESRRKHDSETPKSRSLVIGQEACLTCCIEAASKLAIPDVIH